MTILTPEELKEEFKTGEQITEAKMGDLIDSSTVPGPTGPSGQLGATGPTGPTGPAGADAVGSTITTGVQTIQGNGGLNWNYIQAGTVYHIYTSGTFTSSLTDTGNGIQVVTPEQLPILQNYQGDTLEVMGFINNLGASNEDIIGVNVDDTGISFVGLWGGSGSVLAGQSVRANFVLILNPSL